ncbi:MAG: hypothetical protein P4M15_14755 [Alphaproteobacteria bacterium]|nr:hypothetical protein [Alphaproteobacteria bacterium]
MISYSVLIGAAINIAGSFDYIRNTVAGRTKPNRVTFFLWATASMIAAAAAFSEGHRWEVVPVFISGLMPLLIFCASFLNRNGHWQLQRFDYLCGAFSILALILWRITHDADIAIVFAILADALAMIPTARKAWTHPETETLSAYLCAAISQFTAFIAAPEPSFAAYAFPVYLIFCCGGIGGILLYRRSKTTVSSL